MTDYGFVFSTALHEKLKEKVRAGVFVKSTNDDKLEIVIARKKTEDLVFKMCIENFADKMLHGYSTEYAAYEVLAKYKKFIMNRYFMN